MQATIDSAQCQDNRLRLDCGEIAFTDTGHGPPVLCLHAIGHDARDFSRLAARLGDRFRFIALDWPGHGESPRGAGPASAQYYADIIASAVEALGLRTFSILGNSIGGAAALIYAAAHPDRVQSLTLCNPGGLQPVNWLSRWYCNRMADRFDVGAGRGFDRWFRRYYERQVLPGVAAGWRREEIIAAGRTRAPVLREAWQSFARPEADVRPLVSTLACPVLYAWAKGDNAVSWRRCASAARTAPDYKVALFAGGHTAFLEQPAAFDAEFEPFLQATLQIRME